MKQRLQEYVKYTKAELDSYAETPGSCVYKINTNLHFALNPYVLSDLNTTLPAYILKHRVGYYDAKLNGVLLAVKNIKVQNGLARIRGDDAQLHFDINANCYVFRPEQDAVLTGIPKHIGKHNVGVIIYRVFNASIKSDEVVNKTAVKLNQELQFRVKNFNIRAVHPYIEGTLLDVQVEKETNQEIKPKKITFESDDESSNEIDQHENNRTPDSGIEEKDENNDQEMELTELLSMIKNEPLSDCEIEQELNLSTKKTDVSKHKKESKETPVSSVNIKSEPVTAKKRSRKSSDDSDSSDIPKVKIEKKKIKKEKID